MGKLEESGKRRAKKRNLKKNILLAVQGAALLGVAIAAPNVPAALSKLGVIQLGGANGTIARSRRQLIDGGYLRNEKGFLRLTAKGSTLLQKLKLKDSVPKKPKRWDERWRVLIFDVPEYRKGLREKIRRTLIRIGFVRLQDSVWIYPYDCEDFVVLLKADFKIGKDILYMIVDEIEGDSWIREQFDLPIKR